MSKEKELFCEICGNGLKTASNLKMHMRIHTGEKPHSCRICGKCFARSSNPNVHKRSHTGKKLRPFSCEICGKCFSSKSDDLKRHMQIHAKPQSRYFSQSRYLNTHMRTHDKQFKTMTSSCEICGKCFSRPWNLKRHMEIHNKKNIMTVKHVESEKDVKKSMCDMKSQKMGAE
uniref:zinc finger protein 2 homolog n=1 Tax=Styela clava TaxID=7725 RepID=UPI00193A49F9|nr:zinc finger protein 2 homolog [Styela clava]